MVVPNMQDTPGFSEAELHIRHNHFSMSGFVDLPTNRKKKKGLYEIDRTRLVFLGLTCIFSTTIFQCLDLWICRL